ncbi:hypothetical protein [Chitinophaga niastensis]|nr:hypothetical protein [Chitinophaga niastensis]
MIKHVKSILILGSIFIAITARSQVVVQVNAGSRALWGTNQNLFIDQQGHCQFYLNEVRGTVKDSSSFNIPVSQLVSFLDKAKQVGFFNLKNKYDGGLADGSGIFLSLNNSGQKHYVELLNKDIPEVHELVVELNTILAPHGIKINYGQ